MFCDEASFGRINKPKRCWCPKKCRPSVPYQVVREYTYAYAAVAPHDGLMVSLVIPYTNAKCMSIFLSEVASLCPNDHIVMVLDRASWHTAKSLVIPENIELFPLPPYSPELNPTENIWDEIREKGFRNEIFNSLDLVEERLCLILRDLELDPARVKSIVGWNWIICINLIAN